MNKKRSDHPRTVLYTYWHDLPFQKMTNASSWFNLTRSEVKNFIVKYIRDGIEDQFGQEHDLQRRHAFSAKELKAAYSKNPLAQKYSISNFHFHINNLVEEGYLQEIAKLLEGRHYVTYYGRTAKTYDPHFDEVMSSTLEQNIFGPLKTIIALRNPELKPEDIEQMIAEHIKLSTNFYARVDGWAREMYDLVYDSKLDLEMFSQYAAHYAMIDPEFSKSLRTLSDLIGFTDQLGNTQNTIQVRE